MWLREGEGGGGKGREESAKYVCPAESFLEET